VRNELSVSDVTARTYQGDSVRNGEIPSQADHQPHGWIAHHWVYGQILPRVYWAPEYVLADYWLFALEVPPAGYEWVRDNTDALLVSTQTGEILQVEYGVFA